MINVGAYPYDYDWLPEEKRQAILDWLNDATKTRDSYFENSRSFVNEIAKAYRGYYKDQCARIRSAVSILEALGIMAEYNWAGHRREWILATYADAEMEENWQFQCADYD